MVEVYKADDVIDDPIIGKTSVEVNSIAGYQISSTLFNDSDSWTVLNNDKVTIQELQANGQTCIVKIAENATGTFDLSYGSNSINVIIEQPITMIQGETEVYPYGTYIYTATDTTGVFSIEENTAEITYQENGRCNVEIVTGKRGSFVLKYKIDETIYSLSIKISSL